jgi:DNA-binding response OmpR family regulator
MSRRSERVLVIEDDQRTAEWLKLYLSRAGLDVCVEADGRRALGIAAADPVDLVLLDVMLPSIDGFQVCQALRASSTVPIILITARASEPDRLRGFELGADDYIVKPFSPREVVARVQAVLRRARVGEEHPTAIAFGNLVLFPDRLQAVAGGVSVRLTPIECQLLAVFLGGPGRVFTRGQLVARALGEDYGGSERTIDAHVKNLRRKLLSLPGVPPAIETAHGVGYRLRDRP